MELLVKDFLLVYGLLAGLALGVGDYMAPPSRQGSRSADAATKVSFGPQRLQFCRPFCGALFPPADFSPLLGTFAYFSAFSRRPWLLVRFAGGMGEESIPG